LTILSNLPVYSVVNVEEAARRAAAKIKASRKPELR
jgi:hypothetical protein